MLFSFSFSDGFDLLPPGLIFFLRLSRDSVGRLALLFTKFEFDRLKINFSGSSSIQDSFANIQFFRTASAPSKYFVGERWKIN